jgi:hypothetical protein
VVAESRSLANPRPVTGSLPVSQPIRLGDPDAQPRPDHAGPWPDDAAPRSDHASDGPHGRRYPEQPERMTGR